MTRRGRPRRVARGTLVGAGTAGPNPRRLRQTCEDVSQARVQHMRWNGLPTMLDSLTKGCVNHCSRHRVCHQWRAATERSHVGSVAVTYPHRQQKAWRWWAGACRGGGTCVIHMRWASRPSPAVQHMSPGPRHIVRRAREHFGRLRGGAGPQRQLCEGAGSSISISISETAFAFAVRNAVEASAG